MTPLKLFTDKVQVDGQLQVETQDIKQKLLARLAGRHATSASGS